MKIPDEPPLSFVQPNPNVAVVVDRIVPGTDPDYCVHGRTRCVHCDNWCWLGSETFQIVSAGKASPLCMECAILAGLGEHNRITSVTDH